MKEFVLLFPFQSVLLQSVLMNVKELKVVAININQMLYDAK